MVQENMVEEFKMIENLPSELREVMREGFIRRMSTALNTEVDPLYLEEVTKGHIAVALLGLSGILAGSSPQERVALREVLKEFGQSLGQLLQVVEYLMRDQLRLFERIEALAAQAPDDQKLERWTVLLHNDSVRWGQQTQSSFNGLRFSSGEDGIRVHNQTQYGFGHIFDFAVEALGDEADLETRLLWKLRSLGPTGRLHTGLTITANSGRVLITSLHPSQVQIEGDKELREKVVEAILDLGIEIAE